MTAKEYSIKIVNSLFYFIVGKQVSGISNVTKHFNYKGGSVMVYSKLFHTRVT